MRRTSWTDLIVWVRCLSTLLVVLGCARDTQKPGRNIVAANAGQVGVAQYRYSEGYPAARVKAAGGTLRIASPWDVTSFDFHAVSAAYVQFTGRLLFDYLTYIDEDGKPGPWLAKSWEISPDGRSYTFYLRDDVTFSDGTKLNADAVLASLEHMRDAATKSPLAGRYIASYERGEIVNEYTFRAHLSAPFSAFLEVLAQSWLPIYSAKAIRENPKGLASHPVGSGPFTLESFTRQRGFKLVRRPDYKWAPPFIRHDGPANLDRIEVDIVQEEFVRLGAVTSGQYDLCLEVPPQMAANVLSSQQYVLYNQVRKGIPARPIAFNIEKPPFDDVRVRRALALATDRDAIARLTGFGQYTTKTDYLSGNTRGYDRSYQDVLRYDPAAANRLFDEAGWTTRDAEGFRVRDGQRLGAELLVSDAATRTAPVALQADFKRVGFELRLSVIPAAQLTLRRKNGDYQAVNGGYWQTNTPDGLFIMHSSTEIMSKTTFGQNISRVRDAELDELLSGARQATDPARELALHSAAQKRLLEIIPAIPLNENHNLLAASRKVRGLLFETSHHAAFLTGAWLDNP
jgi:peptide/nickel transport system substrate-binding protein